MEFDKTAVTVSEDAYLVEICLIKTGQTTRSASVSVQSCQPTASSRFDLATPNLDYSESSVTVAVSFRPQETRKCFNATIFDDKTVENVEMFAICVLSSVDHVTIGRNDLLTFTITDNDRE